jgi:hypothetical protein
VYWPAGAAASKKRSRSFPLREMLFNPPGEVPPVVGLFALLGEAMFGQGD